MITQTEYYQKWQAFQGGTITQTEWVAFTTKMMDQILQENKELFTRMKFT